MPGPGAHAPSAAGDVDEPSGASSRYQRTREGSQEQLPEAFVALYRPQGRGRPTRLPAEIAERHDWCETLAQVLSETARTQRWELGITEDDTLRRLHAGLQQPAAAVDALEAAWVLQRVAELLGWPAPPWLAPLEALRDG
jgi:hypothetical protein